MCYRILFVPLACVLLVLCPCLAQQQTAAPDSATALRVELNKLMELAVKKREAELEVRLADLLLLDPRGWFSAHFGETEGATLAAQYEKLLPNMVKQLRKDLDSARKDRRTVFEIDSVEARAREGSEELAITQALLQHAIIHSVSTTNTQRTSFYAVGYFVEVGGTFRFIPHGIFSWLRNYTPRLRVGGVIQQRQLMNRVLPVYPRGARESGIQGKVLLQVIIAADGTIKELSVISGPKILADAAVDAVRQWRYHPTLVGGRPAEIVTTIEVDFSIKN